MKRRLLVLIMTAAGLTASAQNGYRMQPVNIQTRWAKEVSPTNDLKEYPRPQLTRPNWENLNGLWEYAITKKDERPEDYSGQILVPFPIESALSGVKKNLQPDQNLWYKKKISYEPKAGERTLLHFGAVDWQATVYVNAKEAGQHRGGYTAFTLDVTGLLKPGNNEVLVKVYDPSDQGINPHGKQTLDPGNIYYTPSSGIWQTVWLERVPMQYVESLTVTPDIDKGQVNIKVNSSSNTTVALTVAGKLVKGRTNTNITVAISNMHLWSPDNPYLYPFTVRLGTDQVKSYFGMRKISIMKDSQGYDRIALNNKPYYNLGTLDQGFWPEGLYTAPTDEALAFDIKAIKAMGFNTIRKHIKVEPARWYYYTDKLGMLVWQDMVNPDQALKEGSKAEFESESKEILSQLHNYPSITTWVLFNEKWGQYDQARLTKWIKGIDPSRIVNGHSGEYLYVNKKLRSPSPDAYINADITDVHSYPSPMMSIKQPGKAQVCGEFGGIGVPVEGHIWDDLTAGWGYDGVVTPKKMKAQFSAMVDTLIALKQQGLSGSIYTQPYDVESEQNGLITYDRELSKLPIEIIRSIQGKLNSPTKNWQSATNDIQLMPVKDESRNYAQQLEEYRKGRRDSLFLRSLTIGAEQKKDTANAHKFYNDYFQTIKNPLVPANITFLSRFVISIRDPAFAYLLNHLTFIRNAMNWPARNLATYNLQLAIYQEQAKPLLTDHPEWNAVDNILKQYPQLDGEYVIGNAVIHYLIMVGHGDKSVLPSFIDIATIYDERYHGGAYNDWAWCVFMNSDNEDDLKKALAWSQKSLETTPKQDRLYPEYLDTYANLHYKLGHKEEAINYEQKALAISPDAQDIKDNLAKMQKGEPTWIVPEDEGKIP